jgi:hypothetical protein
MGTRTATPSASTDRGSPPDRWLAVDERGTGLRATWRPAHGFVNLSVWREERCVETFHLSPIEAGRLISFLVRGLTAAVPTPSTTGLTLVGDAPQGAILGTTAATSRWRGARGRLAGVLEDAAQRLRG